MVKVPAVPPAESIIITPLNATNWRHHLTMQPNRDLVQFFLERIPNGFRIGLTTPTQPLQPAQQNLQAALLHPQVVDE